MNTWTHLPNAAHIDAVLADAKARPKVWNAALDAAWSAARGAAWTAARDAARDAAWTAARGAAWAAARDAAWTAARGAAWGAARDAARVAAQGAMCALIAWDESAALLDLTPDALRTIISTCDGDVKHQAVLLLPAVIARSTK